MQQTRCAASSGVPGLINGTVRRTTQALAIDAHSRWSPPQASSQRHTTIREKLEGRALGPEAGPKYDSSLLLSLSGHLAQRASCHDFEYIMTGPAPRPAISILLFFLFTKPYPSLYHKARNPSWIWNSHEIAQPTPNALSILASSPATPPPFCHATHPHDTLNRRDTATTFKPPFCRVNIKASNTYSSTLTCRLLISCRITNKGRNTHTAASLHNVATACSLSTCPPQSRPPPHPLTPWSNLATEVARILPVQRQGPI